MLFKKINTIGLLMEEIAIHHGNVAEASVPTNLFNFYDEDDQSNPFPLNTFEDLDSIEVKLKGKN